MAERAPLCVYNLVIAKITKEAHIQLPFVALPTKSGQVSVFALIAIHPDHMFATVKTFEKIAL